MERLNKYLAESGVCSRRKADEYILSSRVSVNGIIVTQLGAKINVTDDVLFDGKKVNKVEEKIYLMLNKPEGYVTTSSEQFNRPCVLDLIHEKQRVYPIGRLDMYTTGLLLLTNDGKLVNKIIHPRSKIAKTYIARLNSEITEEKISKLEKGVDIGDYVTLPAIVKKLSKTEVEITIFEGKNRQVRKMIEAVDLKVIKLKRISIGNLKLGNLKEGNYLKLSLKDIQKALNI